MPLDELSLEITYDCPHNCIMCSSSACHPSPVHNEMSTEEIKKLLHDTAKSSLRPRNFSISGGEPLMRDDIFLIMKYANDLGYTNLFYTTGQRINSNNEINIISKEEVKKLSELDIKVIVDLQSSDEKVCDKIMKTDGYFENITKFIKMCKYEDMNVETHFVPMTVNLKNFFDYIDFSKSIGIDKISYLRFVRQGRSKDNPHLELSKKQFKELQYMFIRAEDENVVPIREGHPIDRKFLVDPHYKVPVCRGAIDAPLLSPTSVISMCPAWKTMEKFHVSSTREQPLENIINKGEYYKIFRDFIHGDGWKNVVGKCQECPYLSRCKSGCVAQRLIHNVGSIDIPLEKAILIGADPLCFWGD